MKFLKNLHVSMKKETTIPSIGSMWSNQNLHASVIRECKIMQSHWKLVWQVFYFNRNRQKLIKLCNSSLIVAPISTYPGETCRCVPPSSVIDKNPKLRGKRKSNRKWISYLLYIHKVLYLYNKSL